MVDILVENLKEEPFDFNERFSLHGKNRPQIHRLLARMTDFVETGSKRSSSYAEYTRRGASDGYEVEHIWADHPERHKDEFPHPKDFSEYRNRIGGLLLLPKSVNASYSDKPYSLKRDLYFGQNLLAASLHENAYKNNPSFMNFIQKTKLGFKSHPEFKKADLDARQNLYRALAEQIWNPESLRGYA